MSETRSTKPDLSRRIIHIDMDAFYASVEQRDNPSLRGKPVVVAGSPNGRGVVSAASYEARKFGIHSAMPSRTAAQKCKELIFVRGDFSKYRAVSKQLRAILKDYTKLIEPLSLDECYMDVTELPDDMPTATAVAREIRRRIREELNLTASAGIAPLKFVAKIASDYKKPDGLTVVHPTKLFDFLHPMQVGKIPGVGPATGRWLAGIGIHTIGDLAAISEHDAALKFGKHGMSLWRRANGIDHSRVRTSRRRKSRSAERTFAVDITTEEEVLHQLRLLASRVVDEIKRERLLARTVKIKVRYSDFTTLTRSSTMQNPSDDEASIIHLAMQLLYTLNPLPPIRLLGVGVANFIYPDAPRQLNLAL